MKIRLTILTLTALALSACGGGDSTTEADPSPSPSSSAASATPSEPTSTAAPTPTPGPDQDGDGAEDAVDRYPTNPYAALPVPIKITCQVRGGVERFTIDRANPDFTQAWKTPLPDPPGDPSTPGVYCEQGAFGEGVKPQPYSAIEAQLIKLDRRPSRYTLAIPYEQCVEHDTRWTLNLWPVSRQQVPEAEAALTLCPNHPNAAAIRERIGGQGQLEQELQDGVAFYDGTYRVGKRIQPGTYATTEGVEGCYWERTDDAGETIDNNFVPSAPRVETTIQAGDYSFYSEGCGLWRRVN